MTTLYALSPIARKQFFDVNGNPLVGGKLFYYFSGTTTKAQTYTDFNGSTLNTNPIILDSEGRAPHSIYLDSFVVYTEVLAASVDSDPPTSPIYTENGISIGGNAVTEEMKWAALPIGHAQPFIPSVMGVSIADWLAEHPSWRKLDNDYVPDIAGRALAISSASHVAGSQDGNDNAIIVDHGHAASNPAHNHGITDYGHSHYINDPGHGHYIYDPGHSHYVNDPGHSHSYTTYTGIGGLSGGASIWEGTQSVNTGASTTGIYLAASATGIGLYTSATGISLYASTTGIAINNATTAVSVSNTGVSGVNKNIQRTQYLDWIIKIY